MTTTLEAPMTRAEAQKLAVQTLWTYGLYDWKVKFDNAKRRAGRCNQTERFITISEFVMKVVPASETRDTILHEVAHARTTPERVNGKWDHHGPKWRATFIAMGGNGERCASNQAAELVKQNKGKYTVRCGTCGHTNYLHRQPSLKRSCSKCNPHRYDERYEMVLTETATGRRATYAARPKRRRRVAR